MASRNLAPFLKPYWRWAVLAPLMMGLEVAMDLTQPRLVQRIIDRGIAHGNSAVVFHNGGLMILAALLGSTRYRSSLKAAPRGGWGMNARGHVTVAGYENRISKMVFIAMVFFTIGR